MKIILSLSVVKLDLRVSDIEVILLCYNITTVFKVLLCSSNFSSLSDVSSKFNNLAVKVTEEAIVFYFKVKGQVF